MAGSLERLMVLRSFDRFLDALEASKTEFNGFP
jgi:hypothetical protein